MLQTVATMVSMLLSAGAGGVIVLSIWEDRMALRRALIGTHRMTLPQLPPHTHRVAGPRPARMISMGAPARISAAA